MRWVSSVGCRQYNKQPVRTLRSRRHGPVTGWKPHLRTMTRVIRSHWNMRAANFDEDPEHGLHSDAQRQAWLEVLAKLAGDPPRRVLDIGCGTGVLSILLGELGHKVTGVDFAAQMLDRAREKATEAGVAVQFRLENAAMLSDPDGTYDVVVARHVFWTLPDPAGTIREWVRVLRSDGCLAIIEGKWWTDRPKWAELSPPRRGLAALLHVAGRIVFYGVRPAQWGAVLDRTRARRDQEARYLEAQTQLPFFGGTSAVHLASLLEAQGLQRVIVEPLMDSALWGEVPQHPRYLVVGRR